jgi:hypothetical protein
MCNFTLFNLHIYLPPPFDKKKQMATAGKRSTSLVDTRDSKKVKLSSKEIAVGDIVVVTFDAGLIMYGIVVDTTDSGYYKVLLLCETETHLLVPLVQYYIMRIQLFIPECLKLAKDSDMSKIVALIAETNYFKEQTSKMSVYMRYELNGIGYVTLEYDNIYPPFLDAIENYNIDLVNNNTVIDLTDPTEDEDEISALDMNDPTEDEDEISALDMNDPANVKMLEARLENIRKSMLQVAQKKLKCKLNIEVLEEEKVKSDVNTKIKEDVYNKLATEYFEMKATLSECKVNSVRISKLIAASKQTLEDLNVEYTQDAPLRIAIQLKMITCVTSVTSACKTDMNYSSYAKVINQNDISN